MKTSGNLACNLKVPCSFVFRCMLHFKTRCASLIFSSKTFQNCIILKLFQIDRKRKNLRSKADQISERVLRTIFFLLWNALYGRVATYFWNCVVNCTNHRGDTQTRVGLSALTQMLPCIGELMRPGIRRIRAAIERCVNVWRIEPSLVAEMKIPEKFEVWVMFEKSKIIFFRWFHETFGKSQSMQPEGTM